MSALTFHEKIVELQSRVKVPKGHYNEFGKFHYRKAEDILEAAKPVAKELGLTINTTDDLIFLGDRFYIKSTASASDGTTSITSTAFAREPKEKKGMDESQITGTASSYASKSALEALLGLHNNQDPDSGDNNDNDDKTGNRFQSDQKINPGDMIVPGGKFKGKKISEITRKELTDYCVELSENNPDPSAEMKKFIDTSREFLRSQATKK